MEGFYDSDDD